MPFMLDSGSALSHSTRTHLLCVRACSAEMALHGGDVWGHIAPMFHLVDAFAIYAVTHVGGRHVTMPAFEAKAALGLTGPHLMPYEQHVFEMQAHA